MKIEISKNILLKIKKTLRINKYKIRQYLFQKVLIMLRIPKIGKKNLAIHIIYSFNFFCLFYFFVKKY